MKHALNEFNIGQKIVHPLGGIATVDKIIGERVFFSNGGFAGSCHFSNIKEIVSFIDAPSLADPRD